MKPSALWRMLVAIIVIIIILGGVIIIIIRGPIPEPPPCLVCGLNAIRTLGIAEIILAVAALGIVNKLKNVQRFS